MSSNILVLRINELFHDLEGEVYDDSHPEIFSHEKKRWQLLLQRYIQPSAKQRSIIDVGCGTGFVGTMLLAHLNKQDKLICTDLSQIKLDLCSKKLRSLSPHLHLEMIRSDSQKMAITSESQDVITMNSLLHHIPDPQLLLAECYRILKSGGLLFIGHEPNSAFFLHPFLIHQYLSLQWLKTKIGTMRRRNKNRQIKQGGQKIYEIINRSLLNEQMISSPLTSAQIAALIDFHSPTAGGLHFDRGFDASHLLDTSRWEILKIQTYNHLAKISNIFSFLRIYDRLLAIVFPRRGSLFFCVARKKPSVH